MPALSSFNISRRLLTESSIDICTQFRQFVRPNWDLPIKIRLLHESIKVACDGTEVVQRGNVRMGGADIRADWEVRNFPNRWAGASRS